MKDVVASRRVFGCCAERGRWGFIALGMLSLLCMGTVYSWSIFQGPLQEVFGIQATQSLLPFTVMLGMYAVFMPIAGAWMDRLGPRKMMLAGALLIGGGYFLSGFAVNSWMLVGTYGLVAGAGVGVGYGVPLAVSARWFPDRRGVALGITVIGFGLSPLVTAPLAEGMINWLGVLPTFRVLGVVFGGVIGLVGLFMRFPPGGWQPVGVPEVDHGASWGASALLPVWRFAGFRSLWVCFVLGTFVGLSAIGISGSVGREMIGVDGRTAAGAVSLFALCNGAGRPVFGRLADVWHPSRAASVSYGLIAVASGLMLLAGEGDVALYLVAFCLFWFCLGGWLALAPTATLKLFPPAGYARNYGVVFTAYGVGALLGTLVTGGIRDVFGSYRLVFYPLGVLALVGIVVAEGVLRRAGRRRG